MPLFLLEHSPFHNFLIPGIILFTVLGIVPVGVTIALIKKPVSAFAQFFNCYKDMYWAWTYCIYIAFALIIWIQTEMTFIRAVHWSHSLYMFFAVAIIFVALLPKIRSRYRKSHR
jgi:magnesium-transporting ATPase (P-type)